MHVEHSVFGQGLASANHRGSGDRRNEVDRQRSARRSQLCPLAPDLPGIDGPERREEGIPVLVKKFEAAVAGGIPIIKAIREGLAANHIEWLAGIILILCTLEFTRRVAGWFIPVLIIVSLSYVSWWGQHISGVFKFAGLSLETILFRSVYGDDALFGTIASISSTYVFMFILFGAFLLRSGAGEFVIDLARAVALLAAGDLVAPMPGVP